VLLSEQIRDIRNAAAFALSDAEHGADRVALLGWGMAGGMVLPAARHLDGLCAVACVNGFYDGPRVQRAVRGEEEWEKFLTWLQTERQELTRSADLTGKSGSVCRCQYANGRPKKSAKPLSLLVQLERIVGWREAEHGWAYLQVCPVCDQLCLMIDDA